MLGGWETRDPPHLARWFSLEVTPGQAPYLFNEKGETQWASTSAELLATPAALHVFGHLGPFTDLTNQVFRAVDPRRRMPLRFEDLPLKIVDDLWRLRQTLTKHGSRWKPLRSARCRVEGAGA